jgi:hypothetical protein
MNMRLRLPLSIILLCSLLFCQEKNTGQMETESTNASALALTPPMGWNSWDGYGTTIKEDEFKANAEWFAKHLKPFGWQYVVVDMEWFVTNPKAEGNSKDSQFALDRYGPALGRWPTMFTFWASSLASTFYVAFPNRL